MPNPPYIKGIGQLVLDRYTAQDHFEGKQFRHKASQVDLDSPILFSTAIPPSTANNVNQAIIDIAGILNSGGLSGYNKIQVGGIDVIPSRSIINFVSGATVVDNPLTLSTDITISGGGSGITELTGDVIAGPGNGSQSTIIKYLSGFIPGFDLSHTYVINQSEYFTLDYNPARSEVFGKLSALNTLNVRKDLAYFSATPTDSANFGDSSIDMSLKASTYIQMNVNSIDVAKAENSSSKSYFSLQQGAKVPTISINTGSYTVDSTPGLTDLKLDFALALGPCTLTLPKCEPGRVLIISDIANNFSTSNLTITPNILDSIKGGAPGSNYIITSNGYTGFLIGDVSGKNWTITPESSYHMNFTDSDLSMLNILTVNHNLNQQYIQVSVYDNQNNYIVPANINVTSTTSCDIDLTGFRTLLGTWNLIITS